MSPIDFYWGNLEVGWDAKQEEKGGGGEGVGGRRGEVEGSIDTHFGRNKSTEIKRWRNKKKQIGWLIFEEKVELQ